MEIAQASPDTYSTRASSISQIGRELPLALKLSTTQFPVNSYFEACSNNTTASIATENKPSEPLKLCANVHKGVNCQQMDDRLAKLRKHSWHISLAN